MEPIILFSIVIGCMALTMMLLALQSVVLQRMADLDAFEKRVAKMFDANDVRSGFREAFTTKKIAIKIGDSFHEEKVSDSRPAHALDTSDKKETRASKLASVKSFAINYAPNVGMSNKPSIKTLCKQDVIFVNKNAMVQRLIQDCQSFHNLKDSKDEETKRFSVFERPLFVCAIEIYDIVNGVVEVNRILDDGFDGILLRNMHICFNKAGGGAKKMTRIIGQVFAEIDFKQKLLFLEIDGNNPMPSLSSEVLEYLSGVLFVNPTTTLDGSPRYRFGPQHDAIKQIISSLKEHVSMTHEFATFAMMLGSDINGIRPEEVQRLHNCVWADDLPVICRVCTDPSLMDHRETFATCGTKASLSPLNLLQENAVATLLRLIDRIVSAHPIHELNQNLVMSGGPDGGLSVAFDGFNTAFKSVVTPRTRAMLAASSSLPSRSPKKQIPIPPSSSSKFTDEEEEEKEEGESKNLQVDILKALYVKEGPKTPASKGKGVTTRNDVDIAREEDNTSSASLGGVKAPPLDMLKPMYFDTTDVHATPTAQERRRLDQLNKFGVGCDDKGQAHSLSMVELVSGLMNATSSKNILRRKIKLEEERSPSPDVMMNSIAVKLKESMNMSNRFADSKDRESKNNDALSVFTPATVHDIDDDSWFDTTDEASVARVATQTSGQRPIGQQDDGYEYDVVLGRLINLRLRPFHEAKKNRLNDIQTNRVLQCISNSMLREKYVGDERANKMVVCNHPEFIKIIRELKYLLRRPIRSDIVAALPNLDIKSMIRSLIASLQTKKSEETKEDDDDDDDDDDDENSSNNDENLFKDDEAEEEEKEDSKGPNVKIWRCYPRTMSCASQDQLKFWLSIQQRSKSCQHIYISLAHPNPVEGVLYAYGRGIGLDHASCVILELLVSRGRNEMLSRRMKSQIDASSWDELVQFVQRTPKKLALIERRSHTRCNALTKVVTKMTLAVRDAAKRRLIQDVTVERRLMNMSKFVFSKSIELPDPRSNSLASSLTSLVKCACWRPDARHQLSRLVRHLNMKLKSDDDDDLPILENSAVLAALVVAISLRRAAVEKLIVLLRDMDPFPTRDPDLSTVLIEMIGYGPQVMTLFGIPKRSVSRMLHTRILEKVKSENPPPSVFAPIKGAAAMMRKERLAERERMKKEKKERKEGSKLTQRNNKKRRASKRRRRDFRRHSSLHPMRPYNPFFADEFDEDEDLGDDDDTLRANAMNYVNGMFFSIVAFIEQSLILTLGSGLFSSLKMSDTEVQIVSMSMLVSFIWNGGFNASIGRVTSFYMFQWSFSLASVAAIERFNAGFLATLPISLFGFVAVVSVTAGNLLGALLFAVHIQLFCTYLMFIAVMVSVRIKPVWFSSGGRALITSYAILAVPSVALSTGLLPEAEEGNDDIVLAWWYCLSLFCADLFLWFVFRRICINRSACFDAIEIPTTKQLDEWASVYVPNLAPLEQKSGATASLKERKLESRRKLYVRDAYAASVREAMRQNTRLWRIPICRRRSNDFSSKDSDTDDPVMSRLVQHRARLFGKEHLLLDWYLLQASKAEPAPLSSEWESTMKEAIQAMRAKRMTDVGLRHSIVFSFESFEMMYGWLYFMFIFVDRLVYLSSGGGFFLFGSEDSNGYTIGMGWATTYLLLGTGIVEIALANLSRFERNGGGMNTVSRNEEVDRIVKSGRSSSFSSSSNHTLGSIGSDYYKDAPKHHLSFTNLSSTSFHGAVPNHTLSMGLSIARHNARVRGDRRRSKGFDETKSNMSTLHQLAVSAPSLSAAPSGKSKKLNSSKTKSKSNSSKQRISSVDILRGKNISNVLTKIRDAEEKTKESETARIRRFGSMVDDDLLIDRGHGAFMPQSKSGPPRLCDSGDAIPLIKVRLMSKAKFHRNEIRKLLFRVGLLWLPVAAVVGVTTYDDDWSDFVDHPVFSFVLGSLGYTALLVALVNKLYIGANVVEACHAIICGILLGYVITLPLLLITQKAGFASVAVFVAGTTYATHTWSHMSATSARSIEKWADDTGDESLAHFGEDHKLLSPNVLTSGQSWPGAKISKRPLERHKMLCEIQNLSSQERLAVTIVSSRGKRLLERLHRSIDLITGSAPRSLHRVLRDAFPAEEALNVLRKAISSFESQHVHMYMVPSRVLRGKKEGEGFSAISVEIPSEESNENVVDVYVGIPWHRVEDSKLVDQLLLEAFVHEVAETVMHLSHKMATLLELLVLPGHLSCAPPKGKHKKRKKNTSTFLSGSIVEVMSRNKWIPSIVQTVSSKNMYTVRRLNDGSIARDVPRSKIRAPSSAFQEERKVVSNSERVPQRVLVQIEFLEEPALHCLSRDCDDTIYRQATLGLKVGEVWSELSQSCRELVLELSQVVFPGGHSTVSRVESIALKRLEATEELLQALRLVRSEFLFPEELEIVSEIEKAYLKIVTDENDRIETKVYDSETKREHEVTEAIEVTMVEILKCVISRAKLSCWLALGIKQAARVALSHRRMRSLHFTKARDQRYKKAEEKSTGKFGTFPHQMLTDYIEDMRKSSSSGDESNTRSIISFLSNCICLCRRRRSSSSSSNKWKTPNVWKVIAFLESMFMALTGSPEFPFELNWLLNDEKKGPLKEFSPGRVMRFLLSYIAIPTYQIGHFFRKNHIWYALLSSRHDVKLVLDLVSRGLNRVVVSQSRNKWYVESKRADLPEKAFLEIDLVECSAVARHYAHNPMASANNKNRNSVKDAKEPKDSKKITARVSYELRSRSGIFSRLKKREEFKSGKVQRVFEYEYKNDEDRFPISAKIRDKSGNVCRTRWYDVKGRTKHEDLTLHKDRRLYHRSPKSTFEKAYMHGWLHERSKKSFGWTKIHVRYFVSCPVEGTLTYWKSEQSWASGDAPWKVISMHDIRVFRSKRTVSSKQASSISNGGNSSSLGSLGGLRSLRTATKNEDRFGLRLITKSDKTTLLEISAESSVDREKWFHAIRQAVRAADKRAKARQKMERYPEIKYSTDRDVSIQATYVHDNSNHPAESYATSALFECAEEDWAMVVNHCHRVGNQKMYSGRVTSLTLRWGRELYHTEYNYNHPKNVTFRTWRIVRKLKHSNKDVDRTNSPKRRPRGNRSPRRSMWSAFRVSLTKKKKIGGTDKKNETKSSENDITMIIGSDDSMSKSSNTPSQHRRHKSMKLPMIRSQLNLLSEASKVDRNDVAVEMETKDPDDLTLEDVENVVQLSTFDSSASMSSLQRPSSEEVTPPHELKPKKKRKRRTSVLLDSTPTNRVLIEEKLSVRTNQDSETKQAEEEWEEYDEEVETPWFIVEDPYDLIRMGDSSHKLASSIYREDLTLLSIEKKLSRRFLFLTGSQRTSWSRSMLWKIWNARKGCLEGTHAQLLDEHLLRKEPLLQKYWKCRDVVDLQGACDSLRLSSTLLPDFAPENRVLQDENELRPDIISACHVGSAIGTRSRLALRFSDLLHTAASRGGRSQSVAGLPTKRTRGTLRVMGLDSGTWPMDGGGVASCRRDVVDRLSDIRWEMIAETGNDMKTLHRSYQVEDHVNSVTFVPLWGADLGSPMQTVRASESVMKLKICSWRLSGDVVRDYLCPLVRDLICGCAVPVLSEEDVARCTNIFVNIHTFFQHYGWVKAWEHPATIRTWCTTWSAALQRWGNDMLVSEYPTLEGLLTSLALFTHFLMPLNVPLTERHRVPVCHVTHHGIQAILGVVAKKKHGTALVVWDHGVLWRERLRSLSNFRGFPLFARNALIGLNRVVVQVVFGAADIVVPCCATNLDWERWLISRRRGGGGGGAIRRELKDGALGPMRSLKAFPVVNGMETYRFSVDRDNENELPTAVMLSHVYELKGVKFAIRAAAVIVNEYGLNSYRLLIYGSLNKDPAYVSECRALIASNNLSSNVFLMGFGNAPKVLTQGWVFVNSSLSEGLPLALGEAGLCGLPVVCTDVGGSREVLTNAAGEVFGVVVPPRDVQRLAAAQVDVFGMLNGLEGLVKSPEPEIVKRENFLSPSMGGSVEALEKRIASQKSNRRLLGMRFREYVLSNFTMSRYLREHYCTLLTAESIYHTRRGTGMTEKLIAELIQERKLKAEARLNNTFMSQDASRLLQSAIREVEQRNYRKMMINSETLNHKDKECRSAAQKHESAVQGFREAIDSARKDAEKVERKRREMISSFNVLNKITNLQKEEKELKVTEKKKKQEKESKKEEARNFTAVKMKRVVSVYNMDGDLTLESLQARRDIVLQMQSNEDVLIKSLQMLRESYVEKNLLKDKRVSQGAIRELFHGQHDIFTDLLSTAKTIENKSIVLRDNIRSCTRSSDLKTLTNLSSAVAQNMLDYAPNLAVFARYVSECSDVIEHIDTCINRHSDLAAYLEYNDSNTFMTLLVAPVVRICSYRDEVDEILHHTSAYHDDIDAWKLVKEAIRISSARVDVNELENIKSQYHSRRLYVYVVVFERESRENFCPPSLVSLVCISQENHSAHSKITIFFVLNSNITLAHRYFSKSGPSAFLSSLKDREYEFDKRVVLSNSSPRLDRKMTYRLVVFKNSIVLVRVVNSKWQISMDISDFRVDFDAKKLRIYDDSGDREIVILETVDDVSPALLRNTSISEVSELASTLNEILLNRLTISPGGRRTSSYESTNDSVLIDDVEFESASGDEEEKGFSKI